MNQFSKLGIAFIFFVVFSNRLIASPIYYNEAIDGELPDMAAPLIFTLDLGNNVFEGRNGTSGVSIVVSDFDPLIVRVSANQKIISVNYEFTNVNIESGTAFLLAGFELYDYDNGILLSTGEFVDIMRQYSSAALFEATLPVGNSNYLYGYGFSKSGSGGYWDYKVTFEVAERAAATVSEPAVIYLYVMGILLFFACSKGRSARGDGIAPVTSATPPDMRFSAPGG